MISISRHYGFGCWPRKPLLNPDHSWLLCAHQSAPHSWNPSMNSGKIHQWLDTERNNDNSTITDNCIGTLQKKKQTTSSTVKDQLYKSLPGLVWQGTSGEHLKKMSWTWTGQWRCWGTSEWGDWPMHSLLHQTEWSPHYRPPVDWRETFHVNQTMSTWPMHFQYIALYLVRLGCGLL